MAGETIGAIISIVFLVLFASIIAFGLILLAIIFWILMLVDVARRKFKNKDERVVWILIIVLTGIVGAAIYYFLVKKPNRN